MNCLAFGPTAFRHGNPAKSILSQMVLRMRGAPCEGDVDWLGDWPDAQSQSQACFGKGAGSISNWNSARVGHGLALGVFQLRRRWGFTRSRTVKASFNLYLATPIWLILLFRANSTSRLFIESAAGSLSQPCAEAWCSWTALHCQSARAPARRAPTASPACRERTAGGAAGVARHRLAPSASIGVTTRSDRTSASACDGSPARKGLALLPGPRRLRYLPQSIRG